MEDKDGEFSLDGIVDVDCHEDRRLIKTFWLVTYYNKDLSIEKNITVINNKLTSLTHIKSFVFQIEKDRDDLHSHIIIQLDSNKKSRPVEIFNSFPLGKIQYIKNIKAAREYCSKKYSRCERYETVYYNIEDKEKKRLIKLGEKERYIKEIQDSKERKMLEDITKKTLSLKSIPDQLDEEDKEDIELNKNKLKRKKEKRLIYIKNIEENLETDRKEIKDIKVDIIKKKKKREKLIKKSLEREDELKLLEEKEDIHKGNVVSSKKKELKDKYNKILEDIEIIKQEIKKDKENIIQVEGYRKMRKERLKENMKKPFIETYKIIPIIKEVKTKSFDSDQDNEPNTKNASIEDREDLISIKLHVGEILIKIDQDIVKEKERICHLEQLETSKEGPTNKNLHLEEIQIKVNKDRRILDLEVKLGMCQENLTNKNLHLEEIQIKVNKDIAKKDIRILDLEVKLETYGDDLEKIEILNGEYEAQIKEKDNIINKLQEQYEEILIKLEKQQVIINAFNEKNNTIIKLKGSDLTKADENDSDKIEKINRLKDNVRKKEKEKM